MAQTGVRVKVRVRVRVGLGIICKQNFLENMFLF